MAVTQIVSGLVRELVCVESQALVRNCRLYLRTLLSKEDLSHCARTLLAQSPHMHRVFVCTVDWPVKREEWGHNLLPLRVSHGLVKGEQQGFRVVAVLRETSSHRGIELP